MEILSKLPERLQELMLDRNINASALAKILNTNPSTVTRYLKGETLPSYTCFTKMLEFFDCSADFLIGLIDFPPTDMVFHPIPPFNEQFRTLMQKHTMSQYRLHHITNFSYNNFNKWLKGLSHPYVDNLIKLAQAFDCSVDYLIGHTLS